MPIFEDDDGNVVTENKPKLKKPAFYTCIIFNDDFTPQDFVVEVLVKVFNLSVDEATPIMKKVHRHGKATVGCYTWEVAEHKCWESMGMARKHEYPLLLSPESI